MMLAMPMTLPGATDSACVATNPRAGTRCSAAFTVVSSTDGLSRPLTRGRRQTAGGKIAGAGGGAGMARPRSASPSPSAPSATCARVSGWPACNNAAGDLAIMEIAQAAEQCGGDLGGGPGRAVHPGENLLVGNLEPGLDFIDLGVAQL